MTLQQTQPPQPFDWLGDTTGDGPFVPGTTALNHAPCIERETTPANSTATRLNRGGDDERESLVNSRERGPACRITPKVTSVAAIHGFMIDIDCGILNADVVGQECIDSPEKLYEIHVCGWLDRDPVLCRAEVRCSGHGLHVLLWLDEPILCGDDDETQAWDAVAKALQNALPSDPNLNGLIALTRPVGALNTKYDPPKTVCQLRAGARITALEIRDLIRRLTMQPAKQWMQTFYGSERVAPCPFCGGESLGVAGSWHYRCYACGRIPADELLYRHYSTEFITKNLEDK